MECTGVGLRTRFGQEVLDNPMEFILLKHEIFRKYATVLEGPNFLHAVPPLIFCITALTILYKLMQFRGTQLSSYLKLSWLPLLAVSFWITTVLNFTMGICYHESLYCFIYKSHKQMTGTHGAQHNEGFTKYLWTSDPESPPHFSLTSESAALSFTILISLFELMIANSRLLPWVFEKTTNIVENVCHIVMYVFSTSLKKITFARQNIDALFIDRTCNTTKNNILLEKGERKSGEQYTESNYSDKPLVKSESLNENDHYTGSNSTITGESFGRVNNELYTESNYSYKLLEKSESLNENDQYSGSDSTITGKSFGRMNTELYTESNYNDKLLVKSGCLNDNDQYTGSDSSVTGKPLGRVNNNLYIERNNPQKLLEKREWINNELFVGGITTRQLQKREGWQYNDNLADRPDVE